MRLHIGNSSGCTGIVGENMETTLVAVDIYSCLYRALKKGHIGDI